MVCTTVAPLGQGGRARHLSFSLPPRRRAAGGRRYRNGKKEPPLLPKLPIGPSFQNRRGASAVCLVWLKNDSGQTRRPLLRERASERVSTYYNNSNNNNNSHDFFSARLGHGSIAGDLPDRPAEPERSLSGAGPPWVQGPRVQGASERPANRHHRDPPFDDLVPEADGGPEGGAETSAFFLFSAGVRLFSPGVFFYFFGGHGCNEPASGRPKLLPLRSKAGDAGGRRPSRREGGRRRDTDGMGPEESDQNASRVGSGGGSIQGRHLKKRTRVSLSQEVASFCRQRFEKGVTRRT